MGSPTKTPCKEHEKQCLSSDRLFGANDWTIRGEYSTFSDSSFPLRSIFLSPFTWQPLAQKTLNFLGRLVTVYFHCGRRRNHSPLFGNLLKRDSKPPSVLETTLR